MTHEELVEKVARVLASHIGPEWESAFASKTEWRKTHGRQSGKHSDINGPFQEDYLDAARVAIKITGEACWQEARLTWRECEGDAASAVDDVSNQIQSLTQGKET